MVLRLIEMIIPEKSRCDLEELLKGESLPVLGMWMEPVVGVWEKPVRGKLEKNFAEKQILVKMLLSTEKTEAVLDILEESFSSISGFRIVLLSVQASLPRPVLPDEGKASPSAAVHPTPEKKPPQDVQTIAEKLTKAVSERVSREELYADVIRTTKISKVYAFMVALSSIVAAVGVMEDSVAVIIGAMVIAPLLGPSVALSLATTLGDTNLAKRALKASMLGIFVALGLAFLMGLVLPIDTSNAEIVSRTRVGLGDVAIALAAGSAGALAFTTGLSAILIGVMVAVALLPPLVTFGLLMGSGHELLALGSILLFITNFICVNLAGVAIFLAQGIRPADWLEARKAKNATYLALLLWIVMLGALVAIIIVFKNV